MADKPRLNGRLEYELCRLVAQGLTVRGAALGLGLAPRTVERWVELGHHGNGHPNGDTYRSLVDGIDAAHAERQANVRDLTGRARRRVTG